MIKRYITRAAGEGLYHDQLPEEQLRAWTRNYPPNVARRMTRLGLMLGEAMREFPITPGDAVVYATTYAETLATERYLSSFPTASPLHFQTSIHPSAIEQVLINRACPVRELTPLAGERGLAAQAALTALLTPGPQVLLTGAEEIGTWLRRLDAASNVGFAFAMDLTENPEGALGDLTWSATMDRDHAPPPCEPGERSGLAELFSAVQQRQPLTLASPAGGEIRLRWR